MKRGINEIIGHSVVTSDGTKGKIKDCLFDRENWQVRYLEVDFGNLFSSDRILIPRTLLKDSHITDDDLLLNVKNSVVKLGPKPEEDLPISRQYEERLNGYYNQETYSTSRTYSTGEAGAGRGYGVTGETTFGPGSGVTESANSASAYPSDYPSRRVPQYTSTEDSKQSSNLFSFKEVNGYKIHATDGVLGSVEDLIIDENSWEIVYMVVDTNNWLPWSKKTLIDISFIENINYGTREAEISLNTDFLKNAPDYDEDRFVDDQYESNLRNYYERSWVRH
ncbi:MAG TPA: PRC-barrel domain-containing protein [Bacteroidales bacterium]|nr:PRC-barrel domain-containing protein [Bacteroidales bacterium]